MRSIPIPSSAKHAAAHIIGARGTKHLKHLVWRCQLALGAEPFASAHGLDRAALPHLPQQGFFVEAGGNDGFSNSDTYYLERARGWRGLLVEPLPQLAAFARRIRSCKVVNAAIGSFADDGGTVRLPFAGSTSRIGGDGHVSWGGMLGPNPTHVTAPLRALSRILDEQQVSDVDFLSLDVEGYELRAIAGIDLTRHAPRLILIETSQIEAVEKALEARYERIAKLSSHDYLLLRRA